MAAKTREDILRLIGEYYGVFHADSALEKNR